MSPHSERNSFIRVTYATLHRPTGVSRRTDGRDLIASCLKQLSDQPDSGDHPPVLLVLMATVDFRPFEELLAAIHDELKRRGLKIPLIGGSVAGIIDGEQIYKEGAQLVCLASRCLDVQIGVAPDVTEEPSLEDGVASLCRDLSVETVGDPNPNGNRFLFCFLPGFRKEGGDTRYQAAEIHSKIRNATKSRIPMFGAVTGDNFKRQECWQFYGRQVHSHHAVVALLDCDVHFGIGMSHGLEGTGEFVFAKELTTDRQRITRLEHYIGEQARDITPVALLNEVKQYKLPILFGGVTPDGEGDRVILYPRPHPDESISVNRTVTKNWPLEIMKGCPKSLNRTVADAAEQAQERGLLDPFHLSVIFAFPCAARYENAFDVGLKPAEVLRECQKQYPGVPLIGALVFGEIGVGAQDRSQLRNWYVSSLLIGDQLTPRSVKRRGHEAIARVAQEMMGADSVSEVIRTAIDAIHDAGLPGGMISLVYRDRHSFVILAKDAWGEGWNCIKPLTQRRADQKSDRLTAMAEDANAQQGLVWKFIRNARKEDLEDQVAVKAGGIISYYVSVLTDSDNRVVGLLQVDLGDMRHREEIPKDMETFLGAVSGNVATALSHVIRMDELRLSELFDQAEAASLTKSTVADSAQEFVDSIARRDLFRNSMMHVRLCDSNREFLDLIAGVGAYYHRAMDTPRKRISTDPSEISPTVKTFNNNEPWWVNCTKEDKVSTDFVESLAEEFPELQLVLHREQSYVTLPIRTSEIADPIGVINVASNEPWFFSESLFRSLQTLGQRLCFVLNHVQEVENERQRTLEIEFLRETTPRLNVQDLKLALKNHATTIAEAAHADVVSFFLWDQEQETFILRGQFGWSEDLVGQASYRLGEGMTGDVANTGRPQYIADLGAEKRKRNQGRGKYVYEMFGAKSGVEAHYEARYEMIGIPFKFNNEPLGILTLQNCLAPDQSGTRFVTTNEALLFKVADDFASYVFAKRAYEESADEAKVSETIRQFATGLLYQCHDKPRCLKHVCRRICADFAVEACAIYLFDVARDNLSFAASEGLDQSVISNQMDLTTVLGSVYKNSSYVDGRAGDAPLQDEAVRSCQLALPAGVIHSFLLLPLKDYLSPDTEGVLVVLNIRTRPEHETPWFTRSDISALERVARYTARAIHNMDIASAKLAAAEERQLQMRRTEYNIVVLNSLTHNLRNRLSGVLCEIRNIVDDTSDPSAKVSSQTAERICEKLAKRASDGLTLLGNNQLPEYEMLDLKEILQSAVDDCAHNGDAASIKIALSCDFRVKLLGERFPLEEAFVSLIDNAIKAMVKRSSGTVQIVVEPHSDTGCVRTSINDTGGGIPSEKTRTLMKGYNQTPDGGLRSSGVTIAGDVFRRHGGEFTISSELGIGTTVSVVLPCKECSRLE